MDMFFYITIITVFSLLYYGYIKKKDNELKMKELEIKEKEIEFQIKKLELNLTKLNNNHTSKDEEKDT